MPSVIHPRSGPFPVYAATSPPTIDVGIFTVVKTGIDLKTAGTNNVFTVPTGRRFVCLTATAIVTAINTAGSGQLAGWQIIESGASGTMTGTDATNTGTPAVGTYWVLQQLVTNALTPTQCTSCAAGNIVQEKHTTSHAGTTTITGSIFVTGFYTA